MDTILTLQQIENLFYNVTCQLLGLDPADPGSPDKVRIAWPTGSTPTWGINDDVLFLRAQSLDDPYVQQRDIIYTQSTLDLANEITSYTRAHQVSWAIYGPNSYENAETVRNGLYGITNTLKLSNLYLQLNIPAPECVSELFNDQWWPRVNFSAKFFEQVTRQGTVAYIKGAQIQIQTERGIKINANSTT